MDVASKTIVPDTVPSSPTTPLRSRALIRPRALARPPIAFARSSMLVPAGSSCQGPAASASDEDGVAFGFVSVMVTDLLSASVPGLDPIAIHRGGCWPWGPGVEG